MLLKRPYYYDIILSDFGRAAAIEYIRSVCDLEQATIQRHFLGPDGDFYDEYRRIMFTFIADLGYFKNRQINAAISRGGVDSDILIGFKGEAMPYDIRDRITAAVIQQVYLALGRGYRNIRIIIPCNTISPLGHHIYELVSNQEKFNAIMVGQSPSLPVFHLPPGVKFGLYTPPALVIDEICRQQADRASLLVLGTPATVRVYQELVANKGLEDRLTVMPLQSEEQLLVNRLIETAIGADADLYNAAREKVKSIIILAKQKTADNLTVVEACTDIRLGLGINSLDVLVARTVSDAYSTSQNDTTNESL
jgi:hypothetical protein